MYIYVFQQSNPEGIDFVLRLQVLNRIVDLRR